MPGAGTFSLPRGGYGAGFDIGQTLEVQTKLRLELAVLCGLCIRPGDQAEVVAVNVQCRVCRFRMIENIAGVDPEFDTPGFAQHD